MLPITKSPLCIDITFKDFEFLAKNNLSKINGLGGKMVDKLIKSRDHQEFLDMSLEFAKYVNDNVADYAN